MSVLVDSQIQNLSSSQDGLIYPFNQSLLQGASYDLCLGQQIARNGRIETLERNSPTLKIVPGEFIILDPSENLQQAPGKGLSRCLSIACFTNFNDSIGG
jgi:deoxycytidine triphosphate deaminase